MLQCYWRRDHQPKRTTGDTGESVRRRRECQECAKRFTTFEHVVFDMPSVIKADGRREKFDEEKLRRGITRALEKSKPMGKPVWLTGVLVTFAFMMNSSFYTVMDPLNLLVIPWAFIWFPELLPYLL